ncbi:polyhydroxyalkanoic acid system family protein [Enterovirga sp.]|uniref:polyhydroxyalkanoic acid system family protein n=1 Tax=Enterovirga sp. TaxID=2026350 RepID=UPI002C810074|nr:polyhydroxyalkanoic acid system family protein [Enterovirga sp.]HMO29569.1 polyhydroxyalkanoic acid system family protein [Enterovirga sp.]
MSKPLVVVIPHQLGLAGAHQRLDAGIEMLKTKFGTQISSVESSWTGDHLDLVVKAVGQSVTAALDVAEDSVRVEVQLPWMLAMIAEKAKSMIQKEGQLLLDKKPAAS